MMRETMRKLLNGFSFVLLTVAIVAAAVCIPKPVSVSAAWNGTIASSFASGSGTAAKPYVIKTEEQMALLLNNVSSGVNFKGLYLTLEADLNMSGGSWTVSGAFCGTLDGKGHTITAEQPLFYTVDEGSTVKRLIYVCTEVSTQALLTYRNKGTLESCLVVGSVESDGDIAGQSDDAGLLADSNDATGTIRNCGAIGAVDATSEKDYDSCAGMVAQNRGSIVHCYSAMTVDCYGRGRYGYEHDGPIYGDGSTVHVSDCYYNAELYTDTCNQGTGYSTAIMTSEDFVDTMNVGVSSDCGWKSSDADSVFKGYPIPSPCYNATVSLSYTDERVSTYHKERQYLQLSTNSAGTIYYTTDGSNPVTSSTSWKYTGGFSVSGHKTIRAVVYNDTYGYSVPFRWDLIYMPGSGTASIPYRISDKVQLDAVRMDTGAHYRMTTDLVFAEEDYAVGGIAYGGWEPIGSNEDKFTGTFDGDGHSITGLCGDEGGLFDYNEGTIRNLRMLDHRLFDSYCSGAIVNNNYLGTVERCYAKSTFTLSDPPVPTLEYSMCYAGGIVGDNGGGTVRYCRNDGLVYATMTKDLNIFAGGIVGSGGRVESCYNTGMVAVVTGYAEYATVAGICAFGGSVKDCRNAGPFYIGVRVLDYSQYIGGVSYAYLPGSYEVYTSVANPLVYTDLKNDGRTYKASISNVTAGPADSYILSDIIGREEYPDLDFENIWMLTEDGPIPQGVMDGEGRCLVRSGYKAPTCTASGSVTYYDDMNDRAAGSWEIPAMGHKYDAWKPLPGVDQMHYHGCVRDGCSALETAAHECAYTPNNDATCDTDGTETGVCVCGAVDTRTLADSALGHDEESHEAQAPTCTEIGWDAYVTCSRCAYSTYEEKAELGHSYTVYVANNGATCKKNDTETAVCDHGCGSEDTREIENSTVECEYINWVTTREATLVLDGKEVGTCRYEGCGATFERAIPAEGPSLVEGVRILKDAESGVVSVLGVPHAVCVYLAVYSDEGRMEYITSSAEVTSELVTFTLPKELVSAKIHLFFLESGTWRPIGIVREV